jgi:formiminotetrahydrofolate cyclodeaminase
VYIDHSVGAFLDELASSKPVPGGGSAAALSGALAAGLVSMVCNLTAGKRRFREAEPILREVLAQSEQCRARLCVLMQEDAQAYTRVMDAYRLSSVTEEERARRESAWQAALGQAALVPMEIAEQCQVVVGLAVTAGRLGSPWAVSDAGAAALLAEAAARAAGLSVEINVKSLADASLAESLRNSLASLETTTRALCQEALEAVQGRMGAS